MLEEHDGSNSGTLIAHPFELRKRLRKNLEERKRLQSLFRLSVKLHSSDHDTENSASRKVVAS